MDIVTRKASMEHRRQMSILPRQPEPRIPTFEFYTAERIERLRVFEKLRRPFGYRRIEFARFRRMVAACIRAFFINCAFSARRQIPAFIVNKQTPALAVPENLNVAVGELPEQIVVIENRPGAGNFNGDIAATGAAAAYALVEMGAWRFLLPFFHVSLLRKSSVVQKYTLVRGLSCAVFQPVIIFINVSSTSGAREFR
jgi:hypothetical protein